MAEEIIYNIATEILKKLGSFLAVRELGLASGVKGELHKLANTVSTVKAVLLDAEEQQATNHEIRDWLRKLKDAVYDVDELLDDFSTQVLQRKVMMKTGNGVASEVRIFFSSSNQLALNLMMGHKIKAIRERLDAIAADRTKFHFTDRSVEMQVIESTKQREETHSFVLADEILGRDEDKKAIVELLLECNVQENVSVIPILGIGGLGKTTLAQLVYNDDKVRKHFELRIWVCVSDAFDAKLIAEKIIESVTNKKHENLQMDRVQDHLRREIEGKKYLLVLDDIWNENRERWLKLRDLLLGGARGSKIVVTTRSRAVAAISGTLRPYVLQGLPEDVAWSLFKKMAFKPGQEVVNPGLVEIGKEVVKKCAGVPLAIRTLGSFLYFRDAEVEWLYTKENQFLEIAQNENFEILPILKLSYDHLPPHLKHCFAYCSLFPKDQDIDRQTLVQLWMAQGFISSLDQNQHLEEVGDRYVMDLLRRSFFQDVKEDGWGNIISCKIHDLIHDLAQLVAGGESSMVNSNTKEIAESIRHVSFNSAWGSSWEMPAPLLKAKKLWTFLLPIRSGECLKLSTSSFEKIISSFRRLRVLDLHDLGIEKVPTSIGKLKNLRYMDLSENNFVTLPKPITRLQNLQTLKLSHCYDLQELPINIHNMVSLRHLELDVCTKLTHMPCGLGRLTSLRTLSQFVVGNGSSTSGISGGLNELNGLINLQGELTVRQLGHWKCSATEANGTKLNEKERLQSLRLEWEQEADGGEFAELLLEDLQPHPNLKKLFIERYGGFSFPRWMMVGIALSLKNIVKFALKNCGRCKHLPPFGQLPSLQHLILSNLTSLEYINICSSEYCSPSSLKQGAQRESAAFFPSLRKLKLYELPYLKAWWKEDKVAATTATASVGEQQPQLPLVSSFPILSKLAIKFCPKLTSLPLHPALEKLELIGVSEKLLQQRLTMMTATTTVANRSASLPLSKLKSLYILEIEDLVSPLEGLQNLHLLEHLEINSCPSLLSFPGEGSRALTTLRFLKIHGCETLTSLSQGMQHLTALEHLQISSCRELDLSGDHNEKGMQFQSLGSLTSLYIQDIPKLVSLPMGLQHVSTLQFLRIDKCYSLLTLPEWISNFRSLQALHIYKCPKLKSLPEGISSLTAIQDLRILICPHLYKRCQDEKGEDWPKIAHIPKVNVK